VKRHSSTLDRNSSLHLHVIFDNTVSPHDWSSDIFYVFIDKPLFVYMRST